MAVPNTNTFTLTNVIDDLNLPSNSSLLDCFNNAVPQHFDPTYEGSKDRLLNFRNYGVIPALTSVDIYGYNELISGGACGQNNTPMTRYTAASNTSLTAVLSNPLYENSSGSIIADAGWYAVQDVLYPTDIRVRYWTGTEWSGTIQNC
jgi:hypothetical protein